MDSRGVLPPAPGPGPGPRHPASDGKGGPRDPVPMFVSVSGPTPSTAVVLGAPCWTRRHTKGGLQKTNSGPSLYLPLPSLLGPSINPSVSCLPFPSSTFHLPPWVRAHTSYLHSIRDPCVVTRPVCFSVRRMQDPHTPYVSFLAPFLCPPSLPPFRPPTFLPSPLFLPSLPPPSFAPSRFITDSDVESW